MKMSVATVAVVWAVSAGVGHADPIAMDFVARTTDSSKMFMTGENDGLMMLSSNWAAVDDPDGPLNGVAGDCFGRARMTAGRMSGNGDCAYKDPEGQSLFVRWFMEDTTTPRGAWQFSGGTGKWATAVGGGLWADTPSDEEGVGLTHVTGTVEFP